MQKKGSENNPPLNKIRFRNFAERTFKTLLYVNIVKYNLSPPLNTFFYSKTVHEIHPTATLNSSYWMILCCWKKKELPLRREMFNPLLDFYLESFFINSGYISPHLSLFLSFTPHLATPLQNLHQFSIKVDSLLLLHFIFHFLNPILLTVSRLMEFHKKRKLMYLFRGFVFFFCISLSHPFFRGVKLFSGLFFEQKF